MKPFKENTHHLSGEKLNMILKVKAETRKNTAIRLVLIIVMLFNLN